MKRWWWLGLAAVLAGPAPGARGAPEAPACVDLPCRVCFVVAEVVGRAGGEPISCAADDPPAQVG